MKVCMCTFWLESRNDVNANISCILLGLSAVDPPELDDPDLVLKSEPEPEAWSVTVDKKVLDKMHKKNIKRQDNIFGMSTLFHDFHTMHNMQMMLVFVMTVGQIR